MSASVSIVIPSYNHARYLDAAIESVLGQDYAPLELIVIDDGSTDGSATLLAKYGDRLRWEVQPNQGQAATLNRGWRLARGEILGYLSADDLLLPRAVSSAVRCLALNPDAVASYCDFNLIDPGSAFLRRVRAPGFDYRKMVTQGICPPGPGALFRRTAYEKAGAWDPRYRQLGDYEFWLRMGLQGRLVRIPEVLAAFRVHPGSQSFTPASRAVTDEPVQVIEDYFSRPDLPADVRRARAQALSTAYLLAARLELRGGGYRRGLRAAAHAVALYPPNALAWRTLRLAGNALTNKIGHRLLWSLRGILRRRT